MDILGSFFFSFAFKNNGLFSCFQIGIASISSINADFWNGAYGVKYGTPKEFVVDNKQKFINKPSAIPKKPENAPKKDIEKS